MNETEILDFKDLYNEHFVLHSVSPHKTACKKGDCFDLLWNYPRAASGLLYLQGCDVDITSGNGWSLTLRQNEIAYLPGGAEYHMRVLRASDGVIRMLNFVMVSRENALIHCSRQGQKLPVQAAKPFAQRFDTLYGLWRQPRCLYAGYAGIVYSLFADMIAVVKHNMQDSIQFLNIAKGIAYMEGHFTSKITNKQLAELCAVSQDYFVRTFKNYYHITPKQYLLDLRLNKAKEQLVAQMQSVNEVASTLGFENATYFSRVFKKKVGMTPTQYRRSAVGYARKEGAAI